MGVYYTTNMGIENFVNVHPRRIRNVEEVEVALARISAYERVRGCKAGVALMQNRQLGSSYPIISEEDAKIGKPSNCENYVFFWPRSYFEELKEKLEREQKQPN